MVILTYNLYFPFPTQLQFEERLKKVVDRVQKSDGEIILFIDEVSKHENYSSTGKHLPQFHYSELTHFAAPHFPLAWVRTQFAIDDHSTTTLEYNHI